MWMYLNRKFPSNFLSTDTLWHKENQPTDTAVWTRPLTCHRLGLLIHSVSCSVHQALCWCDSRYKEICDCCLEPPTVSTVLQGEPRSKPCIVPPTVTTSCESKNWSKSWRKCLSSLAYVKRCGMFTDYLLQQKDSMLPVVLRHQEFFPLYRFENWSSKR